MASRPTAFICLWLTATPCFATETARTPSERVGASPLRPSASEYYTTDAEAGVLARVNIWGDVARPGVYYIPVESSLVEAVSMAGGPTPTAKLDGVRVQRVKDVRYVDLLDIGATEPVHAGDTIFVERSLKADLPLIYGTIGTALSLAAFYFAMARTSK